MFIPFLLASYLASGAQAQAPKHPPDILLFDIGSATASLSLDAFSKEAVVFDQALAQSSWEPASRATLLTGQPSEVHGLYALAGKLPESIPTLAEKLKDAGYDTAAFADEQAWPSGWGLSRGFERSTSTRSPEIAAWLQDRGARPVFLYARLDGEEVPALLDRIKALGRWKSALVVVTAACGTSSREGLYEPALRVPLLLRHPAFPKAAGRRIGALVGLADLAPTVLEAAGVPARGMELPGRSLSPLLRDPSAPWREAVFASSARGHGVSGGPLDQRMVRTKRWKLHGYLYKDAFELYDLQNDPAETTDLARQRPDLVKQLSFQMLKNLELNRPHAPGRDTP